MALVPWRMLTPAGMLPTWATKSAMVFSDNGAVGSGLIQGAPKKCCETPLAGAAWFILLLLAIAYPQIRPKGTLPCAPLITVPSFINRVWQPAQESRLTSTVPFLRIT